MHELMDNNTNKVSGTPLGQSPHESQPPQPRSLSGIFKAQPWLLYGTYLFCIGTAMYVVGALLVFPRYLVGLREILTPVAEWLVWYSGCRCAGLALALFDLLFLFEHKRLFRKFRDEPISNARITVALTAYNDQESIGEAVRDFQNHQRVARVIVVSNNSDDQTFESREAAGALTFNEEKPWLRALCPPVLRGGIRYRHRYHRSMRG